MKTFMVHDLNPVPWKVSTTTRNGNVENYQESLRALLKENYTEEQRAWPEGPLSISFLFSRSTTGGQPADLSNLTKSTEDAIQDIITGNDRNNAQVSAEMYEQGPGVNPMVVIQVGAYKRPSRIDRLVARFKAVRRPKPEAQPLEEITTF